MTPDLTPEQRRRVEELFHQAVGLPAEQRAALLDQTCTNDPAVRHEVEQLLHHHGARKDTAPPGAVTPNTDGILLRDGVAVLDDMSGEHVGPYKLLRRIGIGGFGDVYMAQQEEPVRRRVALKIIKLGMDTGQVIARFEAERQALAMMDHPNIAKVLDAGATDAQSPLGAGRPYFVMELVKGEPITAYCDREKLSIGDRLELFTQLCHAVQHAHQKAVIHRDIKPSNVLVSMVDGRHLAKVIDFGIAKATDHRLTEKTLFTEFNQMIGTPQYMSPEQAAGSPDIDTRTDVYSLGVLLYELLTGTAPFDSKQLRSAAYAEMQRIIREVEPPKPSTRLSQSTDALPKLARARRSEPAKLGSLVRGELDWIVMRCLEKDRARRYETPSALALDIRHHLSSQPVVAAPPSAVYRLLKFVRRNRALATTVGSVAVVLLLATIVTSVSARWALEESRQARLAVTAQSRLAQAEAAARTEAEKALERATEEERHRKKAEKINELILRTLVPSDSYETGAHGFLVTVAMEQAIELLDGGELKGQPATEAALRLTISNILNRNGRSERALRQAQRALEINQQLHFGNHADVATSLSNVGNCLQSLGRSAEALPKYEAALEMRRRLDPGDNSDVASSLSHLARCLYSLGRLMDALSHYRTALEMRRRLFGGDHPVVATSLNNMASCLSSLGRSAEALPNHEAALEMRRRLFEGAHPDVAQSLNNVAGCLQSLGRTTEALPKLEAALEMRRRLFEGDHPDVASSLNNVAAQLESLGRSDAALLKYEAALEMTQRLFEGDHPNVAMGLNNVASCLQSLDRSDEALPKYEEALEMYKRLFEGDHPVGATILNNLAGCLQSLGRSAEALPKYEAAREMSRRLLPPGHPRTMYSQIGLAGTLVALGHYAEAEPLLRDAAGQCERSEAARRLHWRKVLEATVELYDAWHAAEPDKGYGIQAADWRAKLAEWQASTRPGSSPPEPSTSPSGENEP